MSKKRETKQTRSRRSPAQLLEDLRNERKMVADRMAARLEKLDERISRVESRYRTNLEVSALLEQEPAELIRQLAEGKRQRALLRQAVKLAAQRQEVQ